MENRERNIQLIVRVNEKEKALFEEKRRLAKCKNMNLFIRKCVLEKEIYQVDLQPFADLQGLLYNYKQHQSDCKTSEFYRHYL